ncbi:hypothetical protein RSOLAG1IB_12236 [Rhizoctonia solani AG-1 IB]|uniref:C3H1-type domain-containing protein n=1 Tax=Thanatephorus cucumeris (strain AG1-IB / isolate 7/3/14) TaxID=1108050 RepID=M5CCM2_THACB|nr:hypothetical protein BN14_11836 [Rhizoctonia solani AG-1 IB]CEL58962.1 hypothetical protein RSOLAG1IB_12236 [Rhizoctonia solani AG-1 IB]
MAGDALQNIDTYDSATIFLEQVANRLAAGSINRVDADDTLQGVLALPVFDSLSSENLDRLRDSWGRNFDHRTQARDQAGVSGTRAANPSGLDGSSGDPVRPVLEDEDILRQRARESLAAAEQRQKDNQDALRVIFEAIGKDPVSAAPDKALFGWASDAQDTPVNMHPDAAKTVVAVENYSRSIEAARTSLLIQPSKPDFPAHLWSDLLRNQYVDLNKVHSHLHAPHQASRVVEKFSDTFSLVTTTGQAPDKKIKTAAEWCYAWNIYSRAVVFAFRHRSSELNAWNDFIMRTFATTADLYHDQVISMEASMRRHVFGNQALCLWNRSEVAHLQHAYLSPMGSESRTKRPAPGGTGGDAPKGPKRVRHQVEDICKRFNMGTCVGNCMYKHSCSDCGGGHSRLACSKASSAGSGSRGSQ